MDIWQFFLLEKSHLVSMKNRIHLVISWPFNNKLKMFTFKGAIPYRWLHVYAAHWALSIKENLNDIYHVVL